MNEIFINFLYIFMLASFCGYEMISRVPVILHTPLMSNEKHGPAFLRFLRKPETAKVDVEVADVNAALRFAVISNAPEAIQKLLEDGGDINATTDNGHSLLHLATATGSQL